MAEAVGFPCPCCGFRTLPGASPTDEICPVCFWQDDFVDNQDTDVLGPNRVTLSVARTNYARFGASEQRLVGHVREPRPSEGPQSRGRRRTAPRCDPASGPRNDIWEETSG